MNVKELHEIIEKHGMWLRNEEGGERANLTRADLTRANLTGADLTDADLYGANLTGANLTGADLYGANLYSANLTRADLTRADLTDANLTRANLTGADLYGADLTDANLTRANLTGADLYGANLTGANLTDANLNVIKHDLWAILLPTQSEIPGLIQALKDGKVDGSTYEGECACLVGTVAKVRGVSYQNLVGVKPDSNRPAERWFLAIRKGDTPNNSAISKITLEWIEEFLSYTTKEETNNGI